MCLPNLCALFVKLARGQFADASTSVCHDRELDAEREVAERLQLVVVRCSHLLALFATVKKERCIVADQDNHGDAVAKLCQDLLNEPRVGHVEADVHRGKQSVTWWKFLRFGELALRIWVRELHGILTPR